jgi:hypothetical protein
MNNGPRGLFVRTKERPFAQALPMAKCKAILAMTPGTYRPCEAARKLHGEFKNRHPDVNDLASTLAGIMRTMAVLGLITLVHKGRSNTMGVTYLVPDPADTPKPVDVPMLLATESEDDYDAIRRAIARIEARQVILASRIETLIDALGGIKQAS